MFKALSIGKSSRKKTKSARKQGVRRWPGKNLQLFIEPLEKRQMLSSGGFLQGTAFVDANHDHTLDSNDPYLNGAIISLYQGSSTSGTPLATAVTGPNGQYIFQGLAAGLYTLVETPPTGFVNDSTQVLSQLNPATSVNSSTVQVTIVDPSNVYIAFDDNQFFNRNAWDYLQESLNSTTDTETAGQFPVAPVDPSVFTQQFSNAGVTNDSSTVTMTNTSGFSIGQFVKVTDGTTTLYSMITGVSPNVSISLDPDDEWGGPTDNTATVSALTDLNTVNNSAGSGLSSGEYLTFCWDLQNFLDANYTNPPLSVTNVFPVTPTPGQGAPPNAGQIAYLYNHYGTVDITNAAADNGVLAQASVTPPSLTTGTIAEAVGLQVAIWELEYGSSFSNLQVLEKLYDSSSATTAQELSDINTWVTFYVNDSAGKSETATFLQANGTSLQEGDQGMIATGSYDFGNAGITTAPTPTSVTLGTTPVTLNDTATLAGYDNPGGTITFTLYYNGGSSPVDTETVPVNGDGMYTTPTGYKLPTTGTVTGTYQWDASYSYSSGGSDYVLVSDINNPNEQVTVSPASPSITTNAGGTVVLGSDTNLTDSATLVGVDNPGGSITFYLFAPGATPNATGSGSIYSDTVTVNGNGTYYSTTAGISSGSALP
ncbi:MAG: prealbumin-like fold domain-containing protein, partial [Thermoguttaceae bacterium]